jgi:thiosulfate dehydrogenase [quinone] large subunit
MAESTTPEPLPAGRPGWDATNAFLLLRLWLGLRAVLAGVQKFSAYHAVATPLIDPSTGQADASGVMINVNVKAYAFSNYAGIPQALMDKFSHDPLLPKFALVAFSYALGPLLIISGFNLLVGLGTRTALMIQGLLYVGLSIGLILIDQPDGIAWLGIHVGLVAFALLLVEHNRFTVSKRW